MRRARDRASDWKRSTIRCGNSTRRCSSSPTPHRAVGLAGVIGGVDSEVSDDTRRIVLESANFDMKSVRRTARELKLRTDASARFERGLDPNLARDAAARATRSSWSSRPGRRSSAVADVYPQPLTPRRCRFPFTEIERLLGIRYEPEQVLDVLSRLGFSPALDGEGDAAHLRLIVPTWRSDVTLPADVVEEVARVIGYETLPERLPTGQTPPVQRDPVYAMQRTVRSVLAGAGGWETVTYVAIGEDDLRRLDPDGEQSVGVHPVDLSRADPVAQPASGGPRRAAADAAAEPADVAAENLKHEGGVRLFEMARVYLPCGGELPREANTSWAWSLPAVGSHSGDSAPPTAASSTSSISRGRSRH